MARVDEHPPAHRGFAWIEIPRREEDKNASDGRPASDQKYGRSRGLARGKIGMGPGRVL
jgi:hypothetical protein